MVLCLLLLACATVRERPRRVEALTYRIAYDASARALNVQVELPPGHPRHFSFTVPWGEVPLEVTDGVGVTTQVRTDAAGEVTFPKEARRVRYTYPLQRGGDLVTGVVTADGAIVAGRAYLIRPRTADASRPVFLYAAAQLPWRQGAAEGGVIDPVYLVNEADLVDSGFHTFGGRVCVADGGGDARRNVTLLGVAPAVGDRGLCGWIAQALREVATIRKEVPYPRAPITVVTVDSREASPFGMMLWSDPPSLALFAGAQASAEAFEADWVAVHELLHLTHPTFLRRAKWLSEGLATYLTEVARMRSGRMSPEAGWTALLDGFRRGREDARGRTLAELAEGGEGYVGCYWGGALVVLELDVAIRKATAGAHSLEDVLELLATRGISSSPEAFGEAVDEVAGAKLWPDLVASRLARPAAEGADEVLERLGVRLNQGKIVFDSSAPEAAHRIAINHGRRSAR